jgi:hypothetical protein
VRVAGAVPARAHGTMASSRTSKIDPMSIGPGQPDNRYRSER